MPLIIEMVRNGHGCTVMPYVAVRDEVGRGSLAFHPIDRDPLMTVHAIATRGGGTSPFAAEVWRLLGDTMSSLAKSGAWAGATVIGAPAGCVRVPARPLMEAAIE